MIRVGTYKPKNPYAKKHDLKVFNDADEAFNFLNSWTKSIRSYAIEYQGKNIDHVDIHLEYERPTLAAVHYKTDNSFGISYITLNDLLDSQRTVLETTKVKSLLNADSK